MSAVLSHSPSWAAAGGALVDELRDSRCGFKRAQSVLARHDRPGSAPHGVDVLPRPLEDAPREASGRCDEGRRPVVPLRGGAREVETGVREPFGRERKEEERAAARREEREVRLTAQRVLIKHLRRPDDPPAEDGAPEDGSAPEPAPDDAKSHGAPRRVH